MKIRILLLSLLAIAASACKKKPINEIDDSCYAFEFASFSVNDTLQIIKDEIFQGSNLNYLFGGKPTGEWSVALQSEFYALSISCKDVLSIESYNSMNFETWKASIEKQLNYSLETSNALQQIIFDDFRANKVYTTNDVFRGKVETIVLKTSVCQFMELSYNLTFPVAENSDSIRISGKLKVTVPPKK
jgi:hypothetical protein